MKGYNIMNIRMNEKPFAAGSDEIEGIVKQFSDQLVKEMGPLIKSVVWFGSAARGRASPSVVRDEVLFGSDIDVLVLFDDMIHVLTAEVVTGYRIITEKTASRISKRLHITTMPITKFWDYALKGEPILTNMLRDGSPVHDSGCFGMAKKMLSSRKIAPTKEIVWIYLARGPMSLSNSQWNMRQAVLDLYWSVVDAAHSALLHYGVIPETPEKIIPLVKQHLVSKGILDKGHLSVLSEFMNVGKMLMSGEVHKVSGDHYDRYRKEAADFIHTVKGILADK